LHACSTTIRDEFSNFGVLWPSGGSAEAYIQIAFEKKSHLAGEKVQIAPGKNRTWGKIRAEGQ